MFDEAGDSGEEEIDDHNTFPQHVSMTSQGSKQSKFSQVSFIYILLMIYSIFSLSVLTSMMLHWMLRYHHSFSWSSSPANLQSLFSTLQLKPYIQWLKNRNQKWVLPWLQVTTMTRLSLKTIGPRPFNWGPGLLPSRLTWFGWSVARRFKSSRRLWSWNMHGQNSIKVCSTNDKSC